MDENNNTLLELELLLKELINIYKADRTLAMNNYNSFRDQLENVLTSYESSEEARLEKEVNTALKLVLVSSDKLNIVIQTVSKIITSQMSAENREKVARILTKQEDCIEGRLIDKPQNLTQLLEDKDTEENKD